MKSLYKEIAKRLELIPENYASLTGSDTLAQNGKPCLLKFIDRYHAQPEFLDQGLSFNLPAAFIEVSEVRWQSLGRGLQKGQAVVRIHILSDTVADSYQGSENQDIALRIYDTLRAVHKSLQGFSSGDTSFRFSPLTRSASISDTRHDTVSVDIIEYQTELTDADAAGDDLYKMLELDLQSEIDDTPPAQVSSRP